jgi:D-alanine-D-alanine ligase
MSIDVPTDWWKTLFDSIYLMTDARTVGDETLTLREVDLICELIPLRPPHKILDLCGGQGRHSLELCRRGFAHCTVFDYSDALLARGARTAKGMNLKVDFVQGDARMIAMPPGRFDHVILLGNSLGYAGSGGDDLKIIKEAHRLLGRTGWIAVDVTDGRAVRDHFNPNAWHEIGENIVVCRQRELDGDLIRAREVVLDKRSGLVRDQNYGMRLYDGESLKLLVSDAGFVNVQVYEDFSPYRGGGDVGFMDHRIIVTAQKL